MEGLVHRLFPFLDPAVGTDDEAVLHVDMNQLRAPLGQEQALFLGLPETRKRFFHRKKLIIGTCHIYENRPHYRQKTDEISLKSCFLSSLACFRCFSSLDRAAPARIFTFSAK